MIVSWLFKNIKFHISSIHDSLHRGRRYLSIKFQKWTLPHSKLISTSSSVIEIFVQQLTKETQIIFSSLASHLWKYKTKSCLTLEINSLWNVNTLNFLYFDNRIIQYKAFSEGNGSKTSLLTIKGILLQPTIFLSSIGNIPAM